jgi:hypothetical protein
MPRQQRTWKWARRGTAPLLPLDLSVPNPGTTDITWESGPEPGACFWKVLQQLQIDQTAKIHCQRVLMLELTGRLQHLLARCTSWVRCWRCFSQRCSWLPAAAQQQPGPQLLAYKSMTSQVVTDGWECGELVCSSSRCRTGPFHAIGSVVGCYRPRAVLTRPVAALVLYIVLHIIG